MPNQKKEDTIQSIREKLSTAEAVVFSDYRGLSATNMEKLRNLLEEKGGSLHIFKNTLVKLALEREEYEQPVEDTLGGPTAVLFAHENLVDVFGALTEFAKENELPTIKSGYYGKSAISSEKVASIAKLPPLPVLQAQFLGQLNAPISGFVYQLNGMLSKLVWTLNAVKAAKE